MLTHLEWNQIRELRHRRRAFVNRAWGLDRPLTHTRIAWVQRASAPTCNWIRGSPFVFLVWFGLYICPTKLEPIYGTGQKKNQYRKNRPKPKNPPNQRKTSHYYFFSSAMVWTQNLNTRVWTQGATIGACNELARSCVQICVQGKRKSSYDLFRNCLIFKKWSHLYFELQGNLL